jgi:1-pyrroline-5-carboxylate dehydrogenase
VPPTFIFQNEPETDFTAASNAGAFRAALRDVESRFGRTYGAIVDGKELTDTRTLASTRPADPQTVIGRFPDLDAPAATRALEAAVRAFPEWSRVPAAERVRILWAVADGVRRRRHEFSAWMVHEVGKSWTEADGEVAEVIDLLEYYAQQMLLLDGPQNGRLASMSNERTEFFYVPLGAGVVISPWNFPLALTFGMAGAAIVAGNTVVIKPASNSPTVVYHLAKIFGEVGLPPGVLNVVTGSGSVVGNALVDHPRTRFIAFTGSMEVGLQLHERAAKVHPGQIWIKRTVLELGGKNAVIVDRDADLDAAAEGVVASAFGFQGQKCSAGSRAIIDEAVYDEVMRRILARAARLRVGDPIEQDVVVGPVIDDRACDAILRYIEIGKGQATLLLGGKRAGGPGNFVEPTIFGDVDPQSALAQEEIFGPVLSCIRARNFDHALEIANGTKYGLTGAVFSRDRDKLTRARHEFHVGNLYFNRKSTGALMGVHPFGGFNLSGTDSKAGGPDYLLLFLQGKSVGDRTI